MRALSALMRTSCASCVRALWRRFARITDCVRSALGDLFRRRPFLVGLRALCAVGERGDVGVHGVALGRERGDFGAEFVVALVTQLVQL